jgi:uncharacterized membrane protein (UPF0127 family)
MKKTYQHLIIAVAFVVALSLGVLAFGDQHIQVPNNVCIRDVCFEAEIAATSDQRAFGLMNRQHLDEDRGMLFVYPNEGLYQFWMKNTLIPLDMIWIGSDNKIVNIKKSAQPCPPAGDCPTINPGADAQYVLEINGGLSDQFGFEIGDDVTINI